MKENWGQTSRQLHLYWYEISEKLVKWRNEITDKTEIKIKSIMFYTNKPAYIENTQ